MIEKLKELPLSADLLQDFPIDQRLKKYTDFYAEKITLIFDVFS